MQKKAKPSKKEAMPAGRQVLLPGHIRPERYKLTLKPDLEAFVFHGQETIYLHIDKPSKAIELHAVDLSIESVLLKHGHAYFKPKKIRYDIKRELVIFEFSKSVPKGKGELTLHFHGKLTDSMAGFYRSHYKGKDGEAKTIATTQFEATDARRAFPCIDEPAAKAIFDITLVTPPGHTAISNTHPVYTEEQDGWRGIHFAPTPKMSTYLLAFIVGEFEYIEKRTKDGITVRVYTTHGKKQQATFALDTAVKTVEFFNTFFGIPFPIQFLDLIAIPDFAAGAMENWGAITYRETALLVDEQQTSTTNKQWVALVIAHEIAHQWFGNLVTMEWWTHLWLNEGFASYIEYLAVDHIFPEWDIWTQFVDADLAQALEMDSLKNTHPIEVEVGHPKEIREIFDAISYSKGASVIRMLADYLGEKHFRQGLTHYLKTHQYGNASTEHLWQAFAEVSGKPIGDIMKKWTQQPGHPYISVDVGNSDIKLSQRRFFANAEEYKNIADKSTWPIPIHYATDTGVADVQLLEKNNGSLSIGKYTWLKLNAGMTGVYRSHYTPELLARLHTPIRKKILGPIDRMNIISDAFALSRAGLLPLTTVFELLVNYKDGIDLTVWRTIAHHLNELADLFVEDSLYKNYELFARWLFSGITKKVGWQPKPKEDHGTSLLRPLVLGQSAHYENPSIVTEGLKRFKTIEKKNNLPADIRGVVYAIGAKHGNRKGFSLLQNLYEQTDFQEEKNRLGAALGRFKDTVLLQRALEFGLSDQVRKQEKIRVFSTVAANPKGRKLAWQFIQKNWEILEKMYGEGGLFLLGRLIESTTQHFSTLEDAKAVESFFKKHPIPSAERTIRQSIEWIRSNAHWRTKERKSLAKWLKENAATYQK